MNLGAVANDAAQVFGMPNFATAPALAQARILIDVNAALEQLQAAGEDFYGRETLTVDMVAGTSLYVLPKNLQTVLDPVELSDGTVLRELTSHGQVLHYGQLFLGQTDNTVATGKPAAYFVEAVRDTTIDGLQDSVKTTIQLFPAPSSTYASLDLTLNVIREPTLFSAADLTAGTSVLAVPHKYVESIFLPLMRWNLTGSFLFYDKEKMSHLEAEYERALQLLTGIDPRRPKPKDSNPRTLAVARQQQPAEAGQKQS